jgi:hypothetical protein
MFYLIMKHRIVRVTEFKAKGLALPDGNVDRSAWKSPEGAWTGKVLQVLRHDGDVIHHFRYPRRRPRGPLHFLPLEP